MILALQHNAIPPQIHCDPPTDKVDWSLLRLEIARKGTAQPSALGLAGVSSFGMSGTNAHVILQAYVDAIERPVASGPWLFCFSARDEEDLHRLLARFLAWSSAGVRAEDVAYTLQTGRRHERERLAVTAASLPELWERLAGVLKGEADMPGVLSTAAIRPPDGPRGPAQLPARDPLALGAVARLWCEGGVVDWNSLYASGRPRRIRLPTYPFKRQRLWPSPNAHEQSPLDSAISLAPKALLPKECEMRQPTAASEPAALDPIVALRSHVAELLGMPIETLSIDESFENLGADFFSFIRICQFVRERYGLVVSFQQLAEEVETIHGLAEMVRSRLGLHPAAPAATSRAAVIPAQASQVPHKSYRAVLAGQTLTPPQAQFVAEFVTKYCAGTPTSKAAAETDRRYLANCRMLPFQPHIKELSYPILVHRSKGARFWDVDGNEYIDISMGYGVHLFGYQPDFIVKAVRDQVERGIHIGPQTEQAGGVAQRLCELTGMPRAAFCNSGTEAVMAALRFARAANGRTRFVMFEGSYHGWSDGTLAVPSGAHSAAAMARGVGAGAIEDVVVLDYGVAESLRVIAELGPELAAVLVEPVQSRRPDLQPVNFLQELRRITREADVALIFDEVITGFRVGPRGAQGWCDVDADLVTYGKILGGGLPIGAIAGRARYLDTIDGGQWRFGDDSAPSVPTTFFGGTFNKNPLSMAAAEAVLIELQKSGPELQCRIAGQVAWLAERFNAFAQEEDYPLKIVHFTSMFRFIGEGDYSLQRFPLPMDLFFHMMALRGIYILETRVCFLSASHTDIDVELVLKSAQDSLRALRAAGFFPRSSVVSVKGAELLETRLKDDARLGVGFTLAKGTPAKIAEEVLLTGATGFLGAHLLRELLNTSDARIHCLVRARDTNEATRKLRLSILPHGCAHEDVIRRVVAVPADLAAPQLGLDASNWRKLAEGLDAIYHCGANVNSLVGYDRLRAANVEGTRALLRLAASSRAKRFHFISSDAVFDAWGYHRQAVIYEDEPLAHSESLYGGGYAETKWVADKLVATAREAGLVAAIYRAGTICGYRTKGVGQLDAFFARFLKGIVQLGVCPEIDAIIDVAPVDYVAHTIVRLGQTGVPETYHLTHPDPIPYEELIRSLWEHGYPIDVVPCHQWVAALGALRFEDGNALYALLPLFTETSAPFFRRSRLDTRHVRQTNGAPPPAMAELLSGYIKGLEDVGFLPAPKLTSRAGLDPRIASDA